MEQNPDVVIVGGGLAGLTSAIHLSKNGLKVMVLEKSGYPRHKVCGEYVSNEVLPYLKWLGADVSSLKPVNITAFEFSSLSGKTLKTALPLGGFGISRYALDNYLYTLALESGCSVIEAIVTDIAFTDDMFTITTSDTAYKTRTVIGAYGKRAALDQSLSREFFTKKSPWLAVKAHYAGEFPDDVVGLHHFNGGYCGVSKTEENKINICYLADYASFKKYKDIYEYQAKVVSRNSQLKKILGESIMIFDKPLTISQISFDKKEPVEQHILMAGDTAGLIHPLCGNGMAMAIHSAKLVSELVTNFHNGTITRNEMEKEYAAHWAKHFSKRLRMGRLLGSMLQNKRLTRHILRLINIFPGLLPVMIRQTHGKPIKINE